MWLELPIGPFRISTVLTAVALGAVLLYKTRKPVVVFAGVMAWLGGYEVLYIGTGTLLHGWSVTAFFWTANLAAWVLWAWTLGVRPNPWLLILFAVTWVNWMALGFVANTPGYPWRWDDEVLNVTTKTLLALAFAAGPEWLRLRIPIGTLARRTGQ